MYLCLIIKSLIIQVIVQRTLAAKNISHAKAGCVMAATLKLLPLFTLVMPGMVARVLYPKEVKSALDLIILIYISSYIVLYYLQRCMFQLFYLFYFKQLIHFKFQIGCSDPVKCEEYCSTASGCSNKAYILLVLRVLPHGKVILN